MHADIPHQELIFLDEVDPVSSPLKAKGVRVRDYPITLDKLIGKRPQVA